MPIRFSNEQARAVIAARRMFNNAQEEMARRFGLGDTPGSELIGNAQTLPRDIWEAWDRDSITLQRDAMPLYDRLASRVGSPISIGKLVTYFGKIGDNSEAIVSLDGTAKARRDAATISYEGVPVPIVHSGFGFGWRQVQAAQADGWDGLDTATRDNANRKVMEKVNGHLLDGNAQIVYGGNVLYGLRTYPGRNTRSTGVTLASATGAQWVAEVTATLTLLHNDNFKVPATLYVNWTDWFYASNTDFSTTYPNKTIAQRVREIEGVKEVVAIPDLAADEIFAVVEDRRVMELKVAMPIVTRPLFRANPTDNYDFEVMTASAPVFKRDADGNCGIAHSS